MKANEAPEKLYFPIDDALETYARKDSDEEIEYTRTDAFIKKADKFISTFFHPDDTELIDAVLNRFHEHMKLK